MPFPGDPSHIPPAPLHLASHVERTRTGTILLGGGGTPEHTTLVDSAFCDMLETDRVLYLPFAREAHEAEARLKELRESFGARRRILVDAWHDPAHPPRPLRTYGALYIDGGNTFRLLAALTQHRLTNALTAFHLGGGLIYGMSAGAIVLGAEIAIAAHFDPDTAGLTDRRGLNLLRGADVWPHYMAGDHATVCAFSTASGRTVIAVPEDGAAVLDTMTLSAIGAPPTLIMPHPGWEPAK